ncbi:MAG: hypothetical protein R3Y64_10100 [Peptostreptococcaceae bacterium]
MYLSDTVRIFKYKIIQQFKRLKEGLVLEEVNISVNPKHNHLQMEQILIGLEGNVDVSCYLNEDMDYEQIKQIRLGAFNKVNTSLDSNHNEIYVLLHNFS